MVLNVNGKDTYQPPSTVEFNVVFRSLFVALCKTLSDRVPIFVEILTPALEGSYVVRSDILNSLYFKLALRTGVDSGEELLDCWKVPPRENVAVYESVDLRTVLVDLATLLAKTN